MTYRTLLLLGTLCLPLTSVASPPSPPRARTVVSVAPGFLAFSVIALEVEHAILEHVSLFAAGGASPLEPTMGVELGARLFPENRAPTGLFVDLHAGAFSTERFGGYRQTGGGVLVGWTAISRNHLSGSIGAGLNLADVRYASTETRVTAACRTTICIPGLETRTAEVREIRPAPALRFNLGYAF